MRLESSLGRNLAAIGPFESVRRFLDGHGKVTTRAVYASHLKLYFAWLRDVKGVKLSPDELVLDSARPALMALSGRQSLGTGFFRAASTCTISCQTVRFYGPTLIVYNSRAGPVSIRVVVVEAVYPISPTPMKW